MQEIRVNVTAILAKVGDYFSRKFVLAVGSLSAGVYLAIHKIDLNGFIGLVAVVLTAYNGANVAEVVAAYKANKLSKNSVDTESGT
jgi:hypothetical protein